MPLETLSTTMKKLPDLLIVTDRGHYTAYETRDDGRMTSLDTMLNPEALEKLSDQVTDKAGSFPAAETVGKGNSAAERLPLEEELQMRAIRRIRQRTQELIQEHDYESWALVAPPEINNAILEGLEPAIANRLTINLKLNLSSHPPEAIKQRVMEER